MRILAALFVSCALAAAAQAAPVDAQGDAQRGRVLIRQFGCGSCHVIPGISGADASVGPPLTQMGRRIYVAGMLRNTPDNLARWIEHPQKIVPGNVMPEMGVTREQARDIAAYLFTLR
jgi:cytochrome c2